MIWKTISPSELSQWIANQQVGPPPESYELLDPTSVQEALKASTFAPLTPHMRIHPQSGAVDLEVPNLPTFTEDTVMTLSLAIVGALDVRDAFQWTDLDEEEKGSPDNVQSAVGKGILALRE